MTRNDIDKRQSFGARVGYGEFHSRLLIIDFIDGFANAKSFGGYNVESSIHHAATLLAAAREVSLPIAHACFPGAGEVRDKSWAVRPEGSETSRNSRRTPKSLKSSMNSKPVREVHVATKQHASAFFGTSLSSWLLTQRVDTLLIAGCTTSGCVRASVIDASAHGLRPIVVEECVGDRAEEPDRANCLIWMKNMADVVSLSEVLHRLRAQGSGSTSKG